MKQHSIPLSLSRRLQQGAAAVEFALVASLLFILLFGIMEMSRLMLYWNTATEATRLGARLAVVCDMADTTIKQRMQTLFPLLTSDQVSITYLPGGCAIDTCTQVRVTITPSTSVQTFIPFLDIAPTMPPFATTLPRESMSSASNPVCE